MKTHQTYEDQKCVFAHKITLKYSLQTWKARLGRRGEVDLKTHSFAA
jgi:hypothetical protein